MKDASPTCRSLHIVGHGDRLTKIASELTCDANEAHLLVHRVMARALDDRALPSTVTGLETALEALYLESATGAPRLCAAR